MDRIAAALGGGVIILCILLWDQITQAVPASPNLGIEVMVLVLSIIIGLIVYHRTHPQR